MSALGLGEGTPPNSNLARKLAASLKFGMTLRNFRKMERLLAGGTKFSKTASVRHIPTNTNKGLPSSIEVWPNGRRQKVYTTNHTLAHRRQYRIPSNLVARANAQALRETLVRPIYNPEEDEEDANAAAPNAAAPNAAAPNAAENILLPPNTTVPTKQRKTIKRKQRRSTRKRNLK